MPPALAYPFSFVGRLVARWLRWGEEWWASVILNAGHIFGSLLRVNRSSALN